MESDDIAPISSGIDNLGQQESASTDKRFPKSYFKAKPVKIGDEMDVSITEMSKRGDGMTRIDGYVIFVPNTKIGDNVKIKITQIRPSHAIGSIS